MIPSYSYKLLLTRDRDWVAAGDVMGIAAQICFGGLGRAEVESMADLTHGQRGLVSEAGGDGKLGWIVFSTGSPLGTRLAADGA